MPRQATKEKASGKNLPKKNAGAAAKPKAAVSSKINAAVKNKPAKRTPLGSKTPAKAKIKAKAHSAERAKSADAQFLLESLDARLSNFEVDRAKNAYIPLLKASYEFANGNPNPAMPTGYNIVARIRTRAEEALDDMEVLSKEAAESLANDFRAVGMSIEEGVPNPEAFGFVVRETATNSLIVSIRGTQTPAEWVKNFTAIPNLFNEAPEFGLVHLGFEQMWRAVRLDVIAALQNEPAGARVTFLGHSLGGAMATLGTVDIKKNLNRPSVDLCTFGSPRTGKVIFRIKFNKLIKDCFRVAEARDIVPHVPSLITAWNHVGLEVEVRSRVSNPHSLDSYLEGLQGLHANEAPLGIDEGVPGGVLTVRTL